MSTNALENIRHYTWQHYRDNLIEIYRKLPL
jgi:hypothetical protein